jgi:hypothetical protein
MDLTSFGVFTILSTEDVFKIIFLGQKYVMNETDTLKHTVI